MDKELIKHIKNSLQAHEEAYAPGAWERFSVQKSKKPKILFYWPLWSAACIGLIVGGLLYINNNEQVVDRTNKDIAKTRLAKPSVDLESNNKNINLEATKENVSISAINDKINLSKTLVIKEIDSLTLTKNRIKNTVQNVKLSMAINNNKEHEILAQPDIASNNTGKENTVIAAINKNALKTETTFEQLLVADSKKDNLTKTDKNKAISKWQQDIFVASSMGNDNKLNMNYGFSVSYTIAKKLSVSSGIAYTALSTKNVFSNSQSATMSAPASISALSTDTKNLESIDAKLNGINIPLELKYKISDKLYTGIGISAFATIKNKQENNYLVSETKNTSVANTFGIAEQKMQVVTNRVSEQQTETEVINDKYLGFYNFSFGYKQKISAKKNIAVEPFLSLPMKGFSKENLNLTNGGLRLKFEF